MPAKSQAQMSYYGAVIGGQVKNATLSKEKAREMLRGSKKSELPKKIKKAKGKN